MRDSTARGSRTSAIEVVAVMGDTVVDVKLCVARRRRPWLAATSALCLLASGIAFKLSLDHAAVNAAALKLHLATHHPAYSFRPVAQSSAIAIALVAGLGLALATAVAALLRSRRDHATYRVGTAPGVDLPLERAPRTDFPLIALVDDGFVFTVAGDVSGELIIDGGCVSLAELAVSDHARPSSLVATRSIFTRPSSLVTRPPSLVAKPSIVARPSALVANAIELPIPRGTTFRARFGNVVVHASSVDTPPATSLRPRRSISRAALAGVAVTLLFHGGLLTLLQVDGPDAGPSICPVVLDETASSGELVSIDSFDDRADGYAQNEDRTGGGDGEESDRTPGLRLAPIDEIHIDRLPGADPLPPTFVRDEAIELARHAGLLDSAALQSSIASLSMSSDFGDSFGAGGLYGTYESAAAADAFAVRRRFAPEGGGTGWGAICDDEAPCRYGTMGHGRGTGEGYALGSRAGGRGSTHVARVPDVVALGRPTQTGGIPVEVLRRYFKHKSNELTACFEAALLARAPQSETVVTDFIVAPDGTVYGARASGDDDVAACVSTVVSSIEFPAPDGGQAVRVSYPLQFRVPGAS
jgi:hypothetical protein